MPHQFTVIEGETGARIESRLEALERSLLDVRHRLEVLEGATAAAAGSDVMASAAEPVAGGAPERDVAAPLTLLGRTFVVFAGAYLLRALTDAGTLPVSAGVAAGLAYAAAWLATAYRAAPRHATSSALHGTSAVAIAFPLWWEAASRFALVGPVAAALGLALMTAAALWVAWRRLLPALAWAATIAGLATTAALLAHTGAAAVFASYLLALGIGTLWLGYHRDWFGPRWPAALAVNLAVLGMTSRALSGHATETTAAVILVQLSLLGAYLASTAVRTLALGRNVVTFEVVQTIAALAIGLGGAVAVARQAGDGTLGLGIGTIVLAAVSYAVALAFVGRAQQRARNFYFYTSLALVLTLIGTTVLLPDVARTLTWVVLATAAAWSGWRFSRMTLRVHSAVYLFGAAWSGGLLAVAGAALTGSAAAAWPAMHAVAWLVVLASAVCMVAPCTPEEDDPEGLSRAPRLGIAVLFVVGAAGGILVLLTPLVAGVPGSGADAGTLATLRTAVVAAAALVLAAAGASVRLRELGWLLYPLLVIGGLKLAVEDFRFSRPATLFIALALYGAALILAPRIAKRVSGGPPRTTGGVALS